MRKASCPPESTKDALLTSEMIAELLRFAVATCRAMSRILVSSSIRYCRRKNVGKASAATEDGRLPQVSSPEFAGSNRRPRWIALMAPAQPGFSV